MPTYEYQCLRCEEVYEVVQPMADDKHTKYKCPVCGRKTPCARLISGGSGPAIWKDGASSRQIIKTRGYGGKYADKIRPVGTPVDAPANKADADAQFQRFIDSGGLSGIKPSINLNNSPGRPQTTEQQMDKKYK